MITRTPSPCSATATQLERERALELKSLAPCPLGRIGNLPFTVEQGGTPRASRASAFLSTLRMKMTALAYLFVPFAEKRIERSFKASWVHSNSLAIGDLLGSLTACKDDTSAHHQIALKLKALAHKSYGHLYNLTGAGTCLKTYLSELTDNDLKALDEGVLNSSEAKAAILDHIAQMHRDEGELFFNVSERRKEASRVLETLSTALLNEHTQRDRAVNGFIPLFEAGQV